MRFAKHGKLLGGERVLTFTLDTNCLLDVEESRPGAASIATLADAHKAGAANVAVVAISASEKQKGGAQLQNFAMFQKRLTSLKLGHLEVLSPMAYFDITFFDHSLSTGDDMLVLEKAVHEVLFPEIEFSYQASQLAASDPEQIATQTTKWRNAKCDVQALWSHIWHRRDVFVTGDRNFHKKTKKPRLIELRAGLICDPKTAVALLNSRATRSRLVPARGDAEARRLLAWRDREGNRPIPRGLLAFPGRNARAAPAPLGGVSRARPREPGILSDHGQPRNFVSIRTRYPASALGRFAASKAACKPFFQRGGS